MLLLKPKSSQNNFPRLNFQHPISFPKEGEVFWAVIEARISYR